MHIIHALAETTSEAYLGPGAVRQQAITSTNVDYGP